MSDPRRVEALVYVNKKGGSYQPGRSYTVLQKTAISGKYVELLEELFPAKPSIKQVADAAQLSWEKAKKVVDEVVEFGHVLDNDITRAVNKKDHYAPRCIGLEQEMFLLAMRAQDAFTTNQEYADMLYETYGISVSPQFVTYWFQNRYTFRSKFKESNFTPLDKFDGYNWGRWMAFTAVINSIADHRRFNWIDKKHFVNSDVYFKRGRSDPLTGRVENVKVDGNFREAYNCFAAVTENPQKDRAMVYSVGQENGNSFAFLQFVEFLISSRWLVHGDIIIMDNAAIHSMGEADIFEDMLWQFVRDGRPLNVLVVYLPARSPELNPIELCFHILVQKTRKFRRQLLKGRYVTPEAIECTCIVMDNFETSLVARCARHCGYRL